MRVLLLILLLALNAFFAASEVSLLRLRPSRVEHLVEEQRPGAKAVHRLQRRLRRALMLSQLGGTLALVALGWLGQTFSKDLWPMNTTAGKWGDGLIFLVIVLTTTLIAGLLPKALVLNRPQNSALRLAPLTEAVMRTMAPVLGILEWAASILLKLIGLNTQWDSLVPALSAEELETLIEKGGVTGLQPDERNILEGVFALRDTQVREVMVPRSGMVTLPVETHFAELMKEVHLTQHARFLVTGDSLDDVRGLLDLRRLAEPISRGALKPDTSLEPYLQPVPRVLETSTLAELLPIIRSGQPLLLVVDEHGGTEGLVTAADLTGEIVGDEIESENNDPDLEPLEGQIGKWLISGKLEILEINRQLSLQLPEADNHHTLAGFLLEKMQHVPFPGEVLTYKNIQFEVTSMKGPRIEKIKMILPKSDHLDE